MKKFMKKKFDKKMLESALTMSGVFTVLICIILFLMANEPYLIYDVGKTIKTGDLPPIMFTISMGVIVLFFILCATLFSIAHYKVEKKVDDVSDKPKKKRKKKTCS